jgi:hypothetical protein
MKTEFASLASRQRQALTLVKATGICAAAFLMVYAVGEFAGQPAPMARPSIASASREPVESVPPASAAPVERVEDPRECHPEDGIFNVCNYE